MSAQNASLGDATDVRDAGGDRAGGDRAGGDQADTAGADSAGADTAGMLRIGEVAKLTGLTTRSSTLEDVFLTLTGRSLRE